ncbi:lipoprotein, partial [Pseudomonas syringae pv. actinidiae ICMP 19096]
MQESGGRPITRRLVQPIWPAEQLPGVRALFGSSSGGEDYDEEASKGEAQTNGDGPAEFEIVMADAAGNKLAADNVK